MRPESNLKSEYLRSIHGADTSRLRGGETERDCLNQLKSLKVEENFDQMVREAMENQQQPEFESPSQGSPNSSQESVIEFKDFSCQVDTLRYLEVPVPDPIVQEFRPDEFNHYEPGASIRGLREVLLLLILYVLWKY